MSGFDLGLAPRPGGLTHVIDKGLGPRGWEDVLETSGDYIDIVKLGWGTAFVTPNLRAKLDVLRGKPVVIGGTFFEVVFVQDKLEGYKRWLQKLGLTHVEISDGVIDLPRERKLELIEEFATRLHRPLRGRIEGLRRRVHLRGVDDVAARGARRRRLEGDHGSA